MTFTAMTLRHRLVMTLVILVFGSFFGPFLIILLFGTPVALSFTQGDKLAILLDVFGLMSLAAHSTLFVWPAGLGAGILLSIYFNITASLNIIASTVFGFLSATTFAIAVVIFRNSQGSGYGEAGVAIMLILFAHFGCFAGAMTFGLWAAACLILGIDPSTGRWRERAGPGELSPEDDQ